MTPLPLSHLDPLPPEQRHAVNKRMTMNILIQGAAAHAHQSAHHLVRDELNKISDELVPLYDGLIAMASLAYWNGMIFLVAGSAKKFWSSLNQPTSPFFHHRLMRKHGKMLAGASRTAARNRCIEKGVPTGNIRREIRSARDVQQIYKLELGHYRRLEELAKRTCHEIIGTPVQLLNARITTQPAWGTVRAPQTRRGKLLMLAMVGWGGVDRIDGELQVVAKAIIWPLLLHELVKGSMELICLHGMTDLDSGDFDTVMNQTEHLEYEVPMLQIGADFFQRFLKIVPQGAELSDCVMCVSMMEPIELEELMFDMIEAPEEAKKRLTQLLG